MQLFPLTQGCGSGACPQMYFTDRGTVVVQGAPLSAEAAGIAVGAGETLVEVPKEVLLAAARSITAGD